MGFDARDVVFRGAVIVAVGKLFLIELNHLARLASLFPERVDLRLTSVNPNDFVGASELRALFDEIKNLLVVGQCFHSVN